MRPLVSAICCAYNYARWLPFALDSALAQGLEPESLEVIVIDDGSTDATWETVRPYLDSPLVRYVWKRNGGFASSVSRGLDEARGQYVTFLDADDEWPLGRLGAQVEALERNPHVGLVYSDMEVVDETGTVLYPSYLDAYKIEHPSGQVLDRLYQENFVSGGALMVRADLVPLFNPIPERVRCQDWWIATRVASVAEILWVPGVVYRYRQHSANMNLGRQTDRTANRRDEIEFRRLVLARQEADRVPIWKLLDSVGALVAGTLDFRSLALVDADDRARSSRHERQAIGLAREGRLEAALRELVRAQAADPMVDREAYFYELIRALEAEEGARAATHAAA